MLTLSKVVEKVLGELTREKDFDSDEFDKSNSKNDWVAYISAYSGRAADKVFRNEREECDFDENMTKVAALAISALVASEKGRC